MRYWLALGYITILDQSAIACHRSKPVDHVNEVCKIMCVVFSPYRYFMSFGRSYRYIYHILKPSMLSIYRCIGPLLVGLYMYIKARLINLTLPGEVGLELYLFYIVVYLPFTERVKIKYTARSQVEV